MEEKIFKVYAHINKENGKRYIGITSKLDPNKRWLNGAGYQKATIFRKAITKYGWDGFDHVILCDNLTQDEAKKMESKLIEEYKTTDQEYGYNMTGGGDHSFHTEISKQHIREGKANLTEEQLNNIREAAKKREERYRQEGRENSFKGKKHTEESKRKMRENQWSKTNPEAFYEMIHRKRRSAESKCTKDVVRLLDGKLYHSVRDCAEDNKRHPISIKDHCIGNPEIQEFMYGSDYIKLTEQEKKKLIEVLKDKQENPSKYYKQSKAIIDLQTNKIYYSIADCVKELHKDTRTIHKHCQGLVKEQRFMYLHEYNKNKEIKWD